MIKVLSPGLYSTIQDLGRFGYRDLGVPLAGAMDHYSAKMANLLVGNFETEAVIEMTMLGATLEFQCQTNIAVTGGEVIITNNNKRVKPNAVIQIHKGDVLSIGAVQKGFRAYMAVFGGLQNAPVMGSRSMSLNITDQVSLKKNDVIEIAKTSIIKDNNTASLKVNYEHLDKIELDVTAGPEFDRLSKENQTFVLNNSFHISKDHNRMGYQLEELVENNLDQILTAPVLPGTVQLTPSGRIIILMRDGQTTGGYPRILQLSESALNTLAQKKTGDKIRFNLTK